METGGNYYLRLLGFPTANRTLGRRLWNPPKGASGILSGHPISGSTLHRAPRHIWMLDCGIHGALLGPKLIPNHRSPITTFHGVYGESLPATRGSN